MEGSDLANGGKRWGNFISLNGMNTGRFLDGPELTVMHDHGNEQNLFDRVDFKLSPGDSINLNLSFTRSWFQTPNSFDAQNATGWYGLTVDNGGIGPDGKPVGSQDRKPLENPDLQHRAGMDALSGREHHIYIRRLHAPGSI